MGKKEEEDEEDEEGARVNWKRQFKIRHNWARGKCAVEELKLGPDPDAREGGSERENEVDRSKMLVKVVEGLAVTADASFGLRVWDLKTREVVAQSVLHNEPHEDESAPSCMAIDDRDLEKGTLDVSVGFADGSFGVWRFLGKGRTLEKRYRHEKSSNGELVGMSYSHPYLLTATGAVLVSLYTFDVPKKPDADGSDESDAEDVPIPAWLAVDPGTAEEEEEAPNNTTKADALSLPAPFLLTSLKSHTSDPPLALSIRKTNNTTVASIAYTFFTRQGWSIGIQDLHITPTTTTTTNPTRPPTITTRLAYTTPVPTNPTRPYSSSPSSSSSFSQAHPQAPSTLLRPSPSPPQTLPQQPPPPPAPQRPNPGPTTLSYTHPYLLATLPDNTLLLHLCTASATTLSLSPGIRLWGHTSGISDADITARGKAVSVSSRGDEMRVWELEGGQPSSLGLRNRSVEIRAAGDGDGMEKEKAGDWRDERRNWVGFDDEMVIVLKEARGGRESLMVYDFT